MTTEEMLQSIMRVVDKIEIERGGNFIFRLTARKGELYWHYVDDDFDSAVLFLHQALFYWGMAHATKP